jgi:hypothetical protein
MTVGYQCAEQLEECVRVALHLLRRSLKDVPLVCADGVSAGVE